MAFLLFNGLLSAQRNGGQRAGQQGKQSIETMAAELGLTADQQKRIELIQANAQAQRKALRGENLSEDQRQSKQRDLGKQTRDAVSQVLTDEQRTKMRTLKAEKKGKKGNKLTPETRAEVEKYKKENIKPTLQGVRRELELKISADDRQEIDRLRGVMATSPVAGKRKTKGKKEVQKQELTPTERENMKAEAKQWKEAHSADFASLQKLTEKYRGDMTGLMQQVKDKHEQWKTDLKEITAADRAEQAKTKPAKPAKEKGKREMKGNHQKGGKKMAHFLLMDAEA